MPNLSLPTLRVSTSRAYINSWHWHSWQWRDYLQVMRTQEYTVRHGLCDRRRVVSEHFIGHPIEDHGRLLDERVPRSVLPYLRAWFNSAHVCTAICTKASISCVWNSTPVQPRIDPWWQNLNPSRALAHCPSAHSLRIIRAAPLSRAARIKTTSTPDGQSVTLPTRVLYFLWGRWNSNNVCWFNAWNSATVSNRHYKDPLYLAIGLSR